MIKTWMDEGALIVVDGKDDRRKPVSCVEVGRWQNDTSAPPKPTGAEQAGAAHAASAELVERSGSVARGGGLLSLEISKRTPAGSTYFHMRGIG
jgi:hypothetical protein